MIAKGFALFPGAGEKLRDYELTLGNDPREIMPAFWGRVQRGQ
jgi:hypothetical protein